MDIARDMRQIGHQAHASTAAKDAALLAMAQAIREHDLRLIDDAKKGLADLVAGRTRNARSALTKCRAKRFAG